MSTVTRPMPSRTRRRFRRVLNFVCLMVLPHPGLHYIPNYPGDPKYSDVLNCDRIFHSCSTVGMCWYTDPFGHNRIPIQTDPSFRAMAMQHPSSYSMRISQGLLEEDRVLPGSSQLSPSRACTNEDEDDEKLLALHLSAPQKSPPPPRVKPLRSYRQMKHRTISDVTALKRPAYPTIHVPEDQSRTSSFTSQQTISFQHPERIENLQPQALRDALPGDYHNQTLKYPCASGAHRSNLYSRPSSGLVQSRRTSLFNSLRTVEHSSLHQVLQSDSNVILDTPFDVVSSPPPRWHSDDSGFLSHVRSLGTFRATSPPSGPYLHDVSPMLPTLVLTCPTPLVSSSPVFVPRSPITFSKFASASSPGNHASFATCSVPALPKCDKCGLTEFRSGTQCKECEEQWLACKIWYQANDGGRRRHLTEPYIKPAESNARNRSMMDALGVPGGCPSPMGLGIQFETGERPARALRRFSHLRPSKTLSKSKDLGNVVGLEIAVVGDTVVSFLKHAMARVHVLVTDGPRDDPHARFVNSPCAATRQVDQAMISWSRPNRCQSHGCNRPSARMVQTQGYSLRTNALEQVAAHVGYFVVRA